MKAGLDSLKFSLNYADLEQFEEIAGVKGLLFTQMISNIRNAWKVRQDGNYKCGLYASYIAYDGAQQEKMADMILEVRPYLDQVYALPLYNQASLIEDEGRGWDFTAGNQGRLDAMRDPLPCWAVFTEGHITHDGKLSACCFDHDGRFTMGDLTKESFMDAWLSEPFRELRAANISRDVSGTACESCVAYA